MWSRTPARNQKPNNEVRGFTSAITPRDPPLSSTADNLEREGTTASIKPMLSPLANEPLLPKSYRPSLIESLVLRWGKLGFTDVFHENVRQRGILGVAFILLFGTPHLGSFANGIYLKRVLKGRRFSNVLDAGCGDGTFTFYVASKYPGSQVLGVDIGEQGLHGRETTLEVADRVQKLLGFPNLRFQQLDLRQLDSRDIFDLVFSFDVLEHVAENEMVLKNIYRALVPGGLLLLRIPTRHQKRILKPEFTAEHARWAAIEHVGQHHDLESLRPILLAIGYQVVSAKHTTGFWGRLSFELSEALKYYRVPEAVQFACIPFLKLLRRIDTLLEPSDGDGLLVLCEK